jgi:REP element-mobilizing transposase RayT
VTRRCSERRLFLRPSEVTDAIFLYALGIVAKRYRVAVHAFCVLSNHFHLVATDPYAELPAFMRDFCSLVARATNASLGRWEGFWSSETSYSAVSHASADDVVAKVAYVLANPVAAALVQSGREWPGLRTAPTQLGVAKLTAARPKVFFSPNGDMPASAELVLTVPPGFASAKEFQDRVAEASTRLEAEHRREIAEAGRSFLGRARVLAQNPFSRPKPGEPRRVLSPRVAAGDKWKRIEALTRLAGFLRAYREALAALRAGVLHVVFPPGTYKLRVEHGVHCAAAA